MLPMLDSSIQLMNETILDKINDSRLDYLHYRKQEFNMESSSLSTCQMCDDLNYSGLNIFSFATSFNESYQSFLLDSSMKTALETKTAFGTFATPSFLKD